MSKHQVQFWEGKETDFNMLILKAIQLCKYTVKKMGCKDVPSLVVKDKQFDGYSEITKFLCLQCGDGSITIDDETIYELDWFDIYNDDDDDEEYEENSDPEDDRYIGYCDNNDHQDGEPLPY